MPVCFQLFKRGEKEASRLQEVDDEMRKYFGAEPDAKHWYWHWYDLIGLDLAMGVSFERQKERINIDLKNLDKNSMYFQDDKELWEKRLEIINWLSENYTADSWYERK